MSAIETRDEDRPNGSDDGGDPNLNLFQRLKREINDAQTSRAKWREEAKRAFDFVASKQWSEADQAILNEQNRPPITFNRTAPIVNAVCGLEVNNRQGIVYLPREVGDSGVNEMYTNAGKWIRDETQAEDEESEAFRDNVICGEGWTETRMDFDEDPMGKVVEERIDPLEMGVNKGATRANYHDARMIYRIRRMSPDDIREILDLDENLNDAALDARWVSTGAVPADGGEGNKKDYPEKTRDAVYNERGELRLKEVTIVQCQYWRRETVYQVATDQDTELQEMSEEDFLKFKERADQMGSLYQHAKTRRKVFYECFIGNRILGEPRKIDIGFQFKAMTGMRDREAKCFYGMVRDMFDPQMWANKWLSQTMHIMNQNAKGGLLAETDAFVNHQKAERDWADPTKIVWVKPGSLQKQKIKERTSIAMPQGLDNLMTFAITSIRDVSGVNLEILGQADREQAASLEAQRRQSAMVVLAALFSSLRRYRKDQGKLLLHFIFMLPEGTLIRILEQGQYKYVPLMKDGADASKYDTIVDQAPTSPDQKQFVWAITAQILQMQILPPQAIIELLKYSPYPESVVQEIRKAMGMDGQMPPEQLAQRLQQAEEALKFMEEKLREAQENQKTAEDQRAIELLKLEIDEYAKETDRLKAQWDARIKAATAVIQREEGANGNGGDIDDGSGAGSESGDIVTTGQQELPDVGGGASADGAGVTAQIAALGQQVQALTGLVTQLVQGLGGPQQQEPVPPVAGIQPEPQPE